MYLSDSVVRQRRRPTALPNRREADGGRPSPPRSSGGGTTCTLNTCEGFAARRRAMAASGPETHVTTADPDGRWAGRRVSAIPGAPVDEKQ